MVTCRFCGLKGCTWARKGKGWELFGPDKRFHNCRQRNATKPKQRPAHIKGPTITGKDYIPQCEDCLGLPWKPCACYPAKSEPRRELRDLIELAGQP